MIRVIMIHIVAGNASYEKVIISTDLDDTFIT